MKTLTVVCPVYNEADVIEKFYSELKLSLERLAGRYDYKILFVMDKGTDATPDILRKIARSDSGLQIIMLSSRFGHQMSLMAGIDHADTDIIIMMDSDMQHPPELIPEMLDMYEKGNDIVYTVRKDARHTGFVKRITSRLFYRGINMISDVNINESAADFRLISRKVAKIIKEQIRERNIFLRGIFSWMGFNQAAVPFVASERFAGKSKYSLRRMIQFGAFGIVSFSKKPLQAAVIVGSIFAALGFLSAVVAVVQFFIYSSIPSGWTTIVVLLSLFSGIQLIFLGIIGEYIGGIFDEVKGRPHYIVEEKINL